jgi:hypothetical protein
MHYLLLFKVLYTYVGGLVITKAASRGITNFWKRFEPGTSEQKAAVLMSRPAYYLP